MTIKREWDYKVPYRNIRTVNQDMKDAALRVLDTGLYHAAWECLEFEKDFVNMFGVNHAVTMNSGTSALIASFIACDVGPGDEVVISPFVFWGAADMIVQTGATPVFVETDPDTFNIDPAKIEEVITKKTKAIEIVHMYGLPCDMDPIREIAQENDIKIVEDTCHATGAKYNGKFTGTLGDAAAFSFGNKAITCAGCGGIAATDNEEIYTKLRNMRYLGTSGTYAEGTRSFESESLGYNFQMPEVQAAIGRRQLKFLPEWNAKRKRNAQLYDDLLADIPQVQTPVIPDNCEHAFLHYVLKVEQRDELKEYLMKQDIQVKVIYSRPVYQGAVYQERFGFKEGDFPISEQLCTEIL